MRLIVIVLALSLGVNGCIKPRGRDVSADVVTETIYHEDVRRTYRVYLPNNFNKDKSRPMALALHGGGGTGTNFENVVSAGTLTAAADQRGVVLVFPEGIEKRWNSGRVEIFKGDRMYDDVGFISAIIDKMVEKYGIDPNRVYATGISNGGFMSIRLALDLSDKIAAVAPVTAQIPKANENKSPRFPISIMIINGTKDPLVPYDGGHIRLFKFGQSRGELLSTQESIDKLVSFNQCNSVAERQVLPDKISGDGTQVEIVKYAPCEKGTEVILVKVIGGGHTWPGGAQYLRPERVGVVSNEINASEMILDFFLRHSRN